MKEDQQYIRPRPRPVSVPKTDYFLATVGLLISTFTFIVYNVTAMDISADLTELGRTPVTVVSAGIKSILDIGRTLEYLVSVFTPLTCLCSVMFFSFKIYFVQ